MGGRVSLCNSGSMDCVQKSNKLAAKKSAGPTLLFLLWQFSLSFDLHFKVNLNSNSKKCFSSGCNDYYCHSNSNKYVHWISDYLLKNWKCFEEIYVAIWIQNASKFGFIRILNCCVFWPANGSFACCWQVKIAFF